MAELIKKSELVKELKDMVYNKQNADELYCEVKNLIQVIPTTTEAEIRAKAVSDIFAIMDNAVTHSSINETNSLAYWVGFLKEEIEWNTRRNEDGLFNKITN